MDSFLEIKSNAFDYKEIEAPSSTTSKPTNKDKNKKINYIPSLTDGDYYYSVSTNTFEKAESLTPGYIKLDNEIDNGKFLSPNNNKIGFIGFGGYTLGKLAPVGELFNNEAELEIEKEYFLKEENSVSSDRIKENYLLKNNEGVSFERKIKYPNFYILKEENIPDKEETKTVIKINLKDNTGKVQTIVRDYNLDNEYYSLVDFNLDKVDNLLDIPNKIEGNTINIINLKELPEEVQQIRLPAESPLILSSLGSDSKVNNVKLIRFYPHLKYEINNGRIENYSKLDNELNDLYICSYFFANTLISDYSDLLDSYTNVHLYSKAFYNSKISTFTIKAGNILENDNTYGKVLENTPYLRDFKIQGGSLNNFEGILTETETKLENTERVKLIGNAVLINNNLIKNNEYGNNCLVISELTNFIKNKGIKNLIYDADFLMSAENSIHTLVIDEELTGSDKNCLNFDNPQVNKIFIRKNFAGTLSIINTGDIDIDADIAPDPKTKKIIYNFLENLNYNNLKISLYGKSSIPLNYYNSLTCINKTKELIDVDFVSNTKKIDLTLIGNFNSFTETSGVNQSIKSIDISSGYIEDLNCFKKLDYYSCQQASFNLQGQTTLDFENNSNDNNNIDNKIEFLEKVLTETGGTIWPIVEKNSIQNMELKDDIGIINKDQILPQISNYVPNLNKFDCKPNRIPIKVYFSFQSLFGLKQLKEIYLPDYLFYYDCLGTQSFYDLSPKKIYIYDTGFLQDKTAKDIYNKWNKAAKNGGSKYNNVFPYNSQIYSIKNNDVEYIGTYTIPRVESKEIKNMQLFTHKEIEEWSLNINDDGENNQGGNI